VDHVSIYLLIAGTYTPLTIAEIGGAWGWGLFAAEWTMAAAGIAFSWLRLGRMKIIPVLFYLLMGWLAVVAWTPISDAVPPAFMRWLIAGGLCYTVGIGAYAAKQVPFAHALWHLFVVGGTGCHIAGMYFTLL
jgi:hemolysin III